MFGLRTIIFPTEIQDPRVTPRGSLHHPGGNYALAIASAEFLVYILYIYIYIYIYICIQSLRAFRWAILVPCGSYIGHKIHTTSHGCHSRVLRRLWDAP